MAVPAACGPAALSLRAGLRACRLSGLRACRLSGLRAFRLSGLRAARLRRRATFGKDAVERIKYCFH